MFAVIKATIGLRVSDEEQMEGVDLGEHGTYAYEPNMTAAPAPAGD